MRAKAVLITGALTGIGRATAFAIAVNNAGTEGRPGTLTEQGADDYRAIFDTNVPTEEAIGLSFRRMGCGRWRDDRGLKAPAAVGRISRRGPSKGLVTWNLVPLSGATSPLAGFPRRSAFHPQETVGNGGSSRHSPPAGVDP